MALDLPAYEDTIPSNMGQPCQDKSTDFRRICLSERRGAGASSSPPPSDTTLVLKNLGVELSVPGALAGRYSVLGDAVAASRVAHDAGSPSTKGEHGAPIDTDRIDVASPSGEPDPYEEMPHYLRSDSVIEHLMKALSDVKADGSESSLVYADAVRLALVARLMSDSSERRNAAGACRMKVPLPKWRLKRAVAYVEANHAQTITLNDLAAAAGLSRMHFAAQFRAATGLRPREYVLQRRVAIAQQLLVNTPNSVVDIAMTVGFQTQAHFTTVFKRFVGDTPYRWRCKYSASESS